jgi:WD40 repeat protein/transcriptional regulator with XRE-family HTH domain
VSPSPENPEPSSPSIEVVDPSSILTANEFAAALSDLTKGQVRGLADRSGVARSTISSWANGQHLPNPNQIEQLNRLLTALGVEEVRLGEWHDALLRVRRSPGPRSPNDVVCPYPGLEAFDEENTGCFFGRQDLVDLIVAETERLDDPEAAPRIILVVGSSGAGKSSLLKAGVTSRLRHAGTQADRLVSHIQLGSDGPEAMELIVEHSMTSTASSRRPVMIVDQFEELFTSDADKARQVTISDQLVRLSVAPDGPTIVIAIRADFFHRLLDTGQLGSFASLHQVVVTPMSAESLEEAIVEPARVRGLEVERALVEVLLRDLHPRGVVEPGTLPLLSHALRETWERGDKRTLKLLDYAAIGGLRGALEQRAEHTYLNLDAADQLATRSLFRRLVNVDEDHLATRRNLTLADLAEIGDSAQTNVMWRFVNARLLTLESSSVGLSHEILLTAWSRLRQWISDDRDSIRFHREIFLAAKAWTEANQDPSTLLTGARLARAEAWIDTETGRNLATPTEHEYIERGRVKVAETARSDRRRRRRLIALSAVTSLLAVATSAMTVTALEARDRAQNARDAAESRRIALISQRVSNTDASAAAELALAAIRLSNTMEARSALLDRRALTTPIRFVGGAGSTALGIQRGGNLIVSTDANRGTAQLIRVDDEVPRRFGQETSPTEGVEFYAAALSDDATLLAAGGTNNSVLLWTINESGSPVAASEVGVFESGAVQTIQFRPNTHEVAVGGPDGFVQRFDLTIPKQPVTLEPLPADGVTKAVAFSPSGALIAAGSQDGIVRVFSLSNGTPTEQSSVGDVEAGDEVNSLAFSPDGAVLAVGFRSAKVSLFDVTESGELAERPSPESTFTSWVNSVAFSPDGSRLAAGSSDSTIRVWRLDDLSVAASLTLPSPITGIGYSTDGSTLITTSFDGVTRFWPTTSSPFTGPLANVYSVSFDASGQRMAVFPGRRDGTVELWDASALPKLKPKDDRIAGPTDYQLTGTGVLSPDGNAMYAGTVEGSLVTWAIDDNSSARLTDTTLEGPKSLVEVVAQSSDGRFVAAGADDSTVQIWDVSGTSPARLKPTFTADELVLGVAFHPTNPNVVAIAAADDKAYLWLVDEPLSASNPRTLATSDNDMQAADFTDDGTLLAVGDASGAVWIWDTSDVTAPSQLGTPLRGPQNNAYGVDFEPGSRRLAAAVQDGTVWVWDIDEDGRAELFATLTASADPVNVVRFAPQGRYLVGASAARRLYVWDLSLNDVVKWACSLPGDRLSSEEWTRMVGASVVAEDCSGLG